MSVIMRNTSVFEILPLIIFVHHAGGMQTRSTPSTTVLIWSLTNDIAPKAYSEERHCAMAPALLTLPFSWLTWPSDIERLFLELY